MWVAVEWGVRRQLSPTEKFYNIQISMSPYFSVNVKAPLFGSDHAKFFTLLVSVSSSFGYRHFSPLCSGRLYMFYNVSYITVLLFHFL